MKRGTPLIVDGYCVACAEYAKGPRYETSTPSDRYDFISSHPGCTGRRAPDRWRPKAIPRRSWL